MPTISERSLQSVLLLAARSADRTLPEQAELERLALGELERREQRWTAACLQGVELAGGRFDAPRCAACLFELTVCDECDEAGDNVYCGRCDIHWVLCGGAGTRTQAGA